MTAWQELLTVALLIAMLLSLRSALRKHREYKNRDFTRKLETVLLPRETIKLICPQKRGRAILTSKRILFETAQGFNAIDLKTVKRVQGNNEKGNRTTSIPKMVSLTIKGEKDYTIQNNCEEFAGFAKALIKKTTPKKPTPKKQDGA